MRRNSRLTAIAGFAVAAVLLVAGGLLLRGSTYVHNTVQGQLSALDRADGDIDALSMRLARARTLAYIANRADWLSDPGAWQGRARELEDRLSDTLHQSLMQRFVDRRTSTLLRSLHQHAGPVLGGIGADGAVTVEGHVVGPGRGQLEIDDALARQFQPDLHGAAS